MIKSLPMALTLARIAAGPIVALLILWAAQLTHVSPARAGLIYAWACGLFAAAALTDWLDGYLARRLGVVSALGAALDHGADKVLAGCALMALAYAALPLDLTIAGFIVVGRDLLIASLREGLGGAGGLKVSGLGKLKAAATLAGIAAVLAQAAGSLLGASEATTLALAWAGTGLLWAGAALALISGGVYAASALSGQRPKQDGVVQP